MDSVITWIYDIVWSDALVYLCMFAGIYFTLRFRFPQLRYIGHMVKLLRGGGSTTKGIPHFRPFLWLCPGRSGLAILLGWLLP